MRLASIALDWARGIPASASMAGECGGQSRLTVELLGEYLELHQGPDGALVQTVDMPDPSGIEPPTARILARGVLTPRRLRKALAKLYDSL